MHAAGGGYVDAVPLSLGKGADPYARDADGKTALDLAQKSKNQAATKLLAGAMKESKAVHVSDKLKAKMRAVAPREGGPRLCHTEAQNVSDARRLPRGNPPS